MRVALAAEHASTMRRSGQLSLLLIADITGYTKFMKLHRASLAHAQDITARLLTAMVNSCSMRLIEIEGDAAFFCAPFNGSESQVAEVALALHRAFHVEQEKMVAHNLCSCGACEQTGNLRVKFVGHLGEVAEQAVGGRRKVIGVDVISVHRMLKNSVPVAEYMLMSEPLFRRAPADVRAAAQPIDENLEGLGVETLHFVDLEGLALDRPLVPQPSFPLRLRATTALAVRNLPFVVGLRKRRPGTYAG
jgi:class 3 adenylate cyclase